MKYKLFCTDLDDTLIGRRQQYGDGLKDAIKRYEAAGGKFVIVTGRMTAGALPVCHDLDLHGEVVTYQGAISVDIDTERVLDSTLLDNALCVKIGRYLESKGIYWQTYMGKNVYTRKANRFTEIYVGLSHATCVETGTLLSDIVEKEGYCPPKMIVLDEPSAIPDILADLREKFGREALINTSKPFIAEIVPKGISKGIAVSRLAKRYGLTKDEVICAGDSDNDITMLDYAGLSVAVQNACEEAKSYADVIAPDCDCDPITWVIDTIALKE